MLLSLSLCWYSVLEGLGCNVLPELQALLKNPHVPCPGECWQNGGCLPD